MDVLIGLRALERSASSAAACSASSARAWRSILRLLALSAISLSVKTQPSSAALSFGDSIDEEAVDLAVGDQKLSISSSASDIQFGEGSR